MIKLINTILDFQPNLLNDIIDFVFVSKYKEKGNKAVKIRLIIYVES